MATAAVQVATAARWAPPPAAIRPSDSSGWPDGPRGTLAAHGFPFYSSRLLAFPAPQSFDIFITYKQAIICAKPVSRSVRLFFRCRLLLFSMYTAYCGGGRVCRFSLPIYRPQLLYFLRILEISIDRTTHTLL